MNDVESRSSDNDSNSSSDLSIDLASNNSKLSGKERNKDLLKEASSFGKNQQRAESLNAK